MDNWNDVLDKLVGWLQDEQADGRLENKDRIWALKAFEFDQELTQENLRKFVDLSKLDKEIVKRMQELDNSKRKQTLTMKYELSQMYSFLKCLVERHKTRIQYYRDDLSNKGVRIPLMLGASQDSLENLRDNLEQ